MSESEATRLEELDVVIRTLTMPGTVGDFMVLLGSWEGDPICEEALGMIAGALVLVDTDRAFHTSFKLHDALEICSNPDLGTILEQLDYVRARVTNTQWGDHMMRHTLAHLGQHSRHQLMSEVTDE